MSDVDVATLATLLQKIFSTDSSKRSCFLPQFFFHLVNYGIRLDSIDRELQEKRGQLRDKANQDRQSLEKEIAGLSIQLFQEKENIAAVITQIMHSLCAHAQNPCKVATEFVDFLETCRSAIDVLSNMPEYSRDSSAQNYSRYLLRMVNVLFEVQVIKDTMNERMKTVKEIKILPLLQSYTKPKQSYSVSSFIAAITCELKKENLEINEKLIHLLISLGNELLAIRKQLAEKKHQPIPVSYLKRSINRDLRLNWIKRAIGQLSPDSIGKIQMLVAILRTDSLESKITEEYKALDLAVAVYSGFIREREDEVMREKGRPFVKAMNRSFRLLEDLDKAKRAFDKYLEDLQKEIEKLPEDSREEKELVPQIVFILKRAADDYCAQVKEHPDQVQKSSEVFAGKCKVIAKNAIGCLGNSTSSTLRKLLWGIGIVVATLCTAGLALGALGVALVIPKSNRYFTGIFKPVKSSIDKADQQIDQFARAAVRVSAGG